MDASSISDNGGAGGRIINSSSFKGANQNQAIPSGGSLIIGGPNANIPGHVRNNKSISIVGNPHQAIGVIDFNQQSSMLQS